MSPVSHENKIGGELTQQQISDIQEAAGWGWPARDIAILLKVDINQFISEYNDPDSKVSFYVRRGELLEMKDVSIALLKAAKEGDIDHIEHLDKIRRDKSFQASKLDIFGTFDDKKTFDRIYEYIAGGKSNELSNNEKLFLDLLTIINSFDRQFGKRATVKFLTQQLGYKYDTAVDYYNQADQLFYSNRNTTKEALRNKYAEMYEDLYHTARNTATTPKDLEIAANILAKAEKVRKLGDAEIPVLPAAMYPRPYRIFSLDPTTIGLPSINRQEVGRQIDMLQIPETDKQRLRREALIEDIDFTELLGHGTSNDN